MKKRLFAIGTLIAATAFFVACGGNDNDNEEQTTTAETTTEAAEGTGEGADLGPGGVQPIQRELAPSRGIWTDNTWSSQYLGLSFTLPTGWSALTDEDISATLELGLGVFDYFGEVLPDDLNALVDVMAISEAGIANVQITFERLDPNFVGITDADYVEFAALGVQLIGGTAHQDLPTVQIGNQTWYQLATELDFGIGVIMHGRQFINISGEFVRMIIISYPEGHSPVDVILNSFSGI